MTAMRLSDDAKLSLRQLAVGLLALLILIPCFSVLYVELVPMGQSLERVRFSSEAAAIALRVNQTLDVSVFLFRVRDHLETVVRARMACETDAWTTRDEFVTAAAPWLESGRSFGMNHIYYVPVIRSQEERALWEDRGRELYGPQFQIKVPNPERTGFVRSPNESIYFPSFYMVSAANASPFGSALLGMDLAWKTKTRQDFNATVSDHPSNETIVTTGVVTMKMLSRGHPGIGFGLLINAPRLGSAAVGASFDAQTLMRRTLEYRDTVAGEDVHSPLNVVLSSSTGEVLFERIEFADMQYMQGLMNSTEDSDTVRHVRLHFPGVELVLTIARPNYTVSPVIIVVYALLLVTAFAMAALLAWEMRLVHHVRKQSARTLEESAKRMAAEETSRTKSAFVSTLSHELRTPIQSIVASCDLIMDTPLTAEQEEYVNNMRACSEMLFLQVGDILDYQKLECNRVILEEAEFSLGDLLQDAFLVARFKAQKAGVKLVVTIDSTLADKFIGDRHRLQQILTNLVDNAIKFTPANGKVSVHVDGSEKGRQSQMCSDKKALDCSPLTSDDIHEVVDIDDQANTESIMMSTGGTDLASAGDLQLVGFCVEDTGIGIDATSIPQLFQPFVQSDSGITRKYGGTGLGLSICKGLAKLMGGDAWVTSEVGKGSKFYFAVRLKPCARVLGAAHEPARGVHLVYDPADPTTLPRAAARVPVVFEGDSSSSVSAVDGAVTPDSTKTACVRSDQAPPTGAAATGAIADSSKPSAGKHKHVVLLVEDNMINIKLATVMLRKLGVEVVQAWDGQQAVAASEKQRFDLVFMDLQMPVMDGLTATRAIRRDISNPNHDVPIVALTANVSQEDRLRTQAVGMQTLLGKPYTRAKLREVLEQWIPAYPREDEAD